MNKGSTVGLLVSKGLAALVVPNAVGLTDATARDKLVACRPHGYGEARIRERPSRHRRRPEPRGR